MRRLFFAILFCLACEEEGRDGLWIDKGCSDPEIQAITEGVRKINEAIVSIGYPEETVHLSGFARSPKDPLNDDDRDMVSCVHESVSPALIGRSCNGEISLYSSKIEDYDTIVYVVLHELGHYIGAEHVRDENAVMYPILEGVKTQYTESDKSSFRIALRDKK